MTVLYLQPATFVFSILVMVMFLIQIVAKPQKTKTLLISFCFLFTIVYFCNLFFLFFLFFFDLDYLRILKTWIWLMINSLSSPLWLKELLLSRIPLQGWRRSMGMGKSSRGLEGRGGVAKGLDRKKNAITG